ncbi:Copia protein [Cyphomyrmex costatus]|uniref:Copia protein n=1 Tax=Cyphomyrmex costatus TaxID=456900 RepID=A0A151IHV9_9HYME|nr:Copia protein [Cyphomyrmex costatus]
MEKKDITIPVFDGEDYSMRKKRITMFLKMKRCHEVITRVKNEAAGKEGIIINNCPAYVHELNDTAERFNRTIMDMARCLLTEAQVGKQYWPEIICAASYLKNRTLANTIERKTPYEIFFRKRPNVEHLRLYGSRVFIRWPEQKRSSKWKKKRIWEFY